MVAPGAGVPRPPRGRSPLTARTPEAYVLPGVLALLLLLLVAGLISSGAILNRRGGAPEVARTAPPAEVPGGASGAAPGGAPETAAPAEPPAAPTTAPTAAPAAPPGKVVIDDDAFAGGFSAPRNYRGRTARWLYGALSPYGQMTASFTVDGTPGAGELLLKGLDSENGDKTPIAIQVNDTVVYQGGNPLPKDTWRGSVAPWGETTIPIPAGALRSGRNTLSISNLAPINNFNAPPYFMLDEAVITYDSASGQRPTPGAAPAANAGPVFARPAPPPARGGGHGQARGHDKQEKEHSRRR
jgi:hypothetical protein